MWELYIDRKRWPKRWKEKFHVGRLGDWTWTRLSCGVVLAERIYVRTRNALINFIIHLRIPSYLLHWPVIACVSRFFLLLASSTTINRSSQWNFHINLKPVYLYFFRRSISMRYNPVPGMLPPLTGSMHTSRAGKQMTIIHTHARHTPIELTLTSSPPTEM